MSKPFAIRTNQHTVYADCLLERRQNGQNEQAIILEVKCFTNPQNDLQEFYTAVGQYQFYKAAVAANQSATPVYLVLPFEAYSRLLRDNAVSSLLQQSMIRIVVVDLLTEEVVQWLH